MPFLTIAGVEVLVTDLAEREPEVIGDVGRTYSGAWRGDTSGEIRAWQGTGLEVAASKFHELRSAVRRGVVSVQGDAIYGGWPRRMRVTMSGEYVRDGAGYLIVPGFTMEDAQVHELAVRYFPGLALTHSRASSATYTASDETIETVASNILRDAHYIDGVRTTLLELQRTNLVQHNYLHGGATTGWSKSGDAAATLTAVTDAAELDAAGLSGIVSDGYVLKLDNSGGTSVANAINAGVAGNTNPHAAGAYLRGSGVARINIGATAGTSRTLSTGFSRYSEVLSPSGSSKVFVVQADAGAVVYFVLGQMEEGSFPTSEIPNDTASSVTRAVDIASYALPDAIADPRTPWVRYTRWVARMDGNGGVTNPRVFQIGDGTGNFASVLLYWTSATNLRLWHNNNSTTDTTSISGLSIGQGDLCEAVVRWNGDGTATLILYVNGASAGSATLSGITPAPAWNGGANTYLNSRDGGNNAGAMSLRRGAFKEGVPSDVTADELMAYMRGEAG